jgi:hypothetical protein
MVCLGVTQKPRQAQGNKEGRGGETRRREERQKETRRETKGEEM